MKIQIDLKLVRFYLWVGFVYSILWFFSNHAASGSLFEILLRVFWRMVYLLVVNFIFLEYSFPFIIEKRRYLVYNILVGIVIFFIHFMLWSYGLYMWKELGHQIHILTSVKKFPSLGKALSAEMSYSAASIFVFSVLRHAYSFIKLKQVTQQLQIEKQQAELNYLKSQTNPHFLFNTLNNIYSLARDKSDMAPEAILRLSKILRFMLYETSVDFISIEKEVKVITDYIELEKLRYDELLRITFHQQINNLNQQIPPLILIPLVENAFKHGTSETTGNQFVDIHLTVQNGWLIFIVKNSAGSLSEKMMKENIGLSNLRRQLAFLFKEYNLTVDHSESVFTVILKINLISHV